MQILGKQYSGEGDTHAVQHPSLRSRAGLDTLGQPPVTRNQRPGVRIWCDIRSKRCACSSWDMEIVESRITTFQSPSRGKNAEEMQQTPPRKYANFGEENVAARFPAMTTPKRRDSTSARAMSGMASTDLSSPANLRAVDDDWLRMPARLRGGRWTDCCRLFVEPDVEPHVHVGLAVQHGDGLLCLGS